MDLGFHPFVGLRYLRGPRHGWSRILLAITAFFVVAAITYLVLTVRRRWLLQELSELLTPDSVSTPAAETPAHLVGVAHG